MGRYTQPMMDRLGVVVTIGGVSAKCLRDEADERTLGDDWAFLIGKALVVQCKTGTFPALANGVAVVVDGVSLFVHSSRVSGVDGETTQFVCVREK